MLLQGTDLPSSMQSLELFQVQTKKLKANFLELFTTWSELYQTPENLNSANYIFEDFVVSCTAKFHLA